MDNKVIWVGRAAEGETCEMPECDRHPACYSIERGSGYVTACSGHAQELIDNAVENGEIEQLPVEFTLVGG